MLGLTLEGSDNAEEGTPGVPETEFTRVPGASDWILPVPQGYFQTGVFPGAGERGGEDTGRMKALVKGKDAIPQERGLRPRLSVKVAARQTEQWPRLKA